LRIESGEFSAWEKWNEGPEKQVQIVTHDNLIAVKAKTDASTESEADKR
jgi:hypothetical protein